MIVVSGKLFVSEGKRDDFLAASREAMVLARKTPGCHDFVVAADPIEKNRVNIYEEWDSQENLDVFRGSGPDSEMNKLIVSADVNQRSITQEYE